MIVEYDPAWPERFEAERAKIAALCDATRIEHIGSTSVPGLAAKPIVDIVVVPQGSIGDAVEPLEAAGYELRVRAPGHRMLRTPARDVHVHLWTEPADVDRHLLFRDWLRANTSDRDLYAATKRELASREWGDGNDYADAKSPVIRTITARADAWVASGARR